MPIISVCPMIVRKLVAEYIAEQHGRDYEVRGALAARPTFSVDQVSGRPVFSGMAVEIQLRKPQAKQEEALA